MLPERLDELLRNADDSVPAPRGDAALVRAVLNRARRRATLRAGISTAASCFVLCACAWLAGGLARAPQIEPAPQTAQTPRRTEPVMEDLASLHAAVVRHEEFAARLLEREKLATRRIRVVETLGAPGSMDGLSAICDEAAEILLHHGHRLDADAARGAEAESMYQCVATNFPNSRAGVAAKARLTALRNQKRSN